MHYGKNHTAIFFVTAVFAASLAAAAAPARAQEDEAVVEPKVVTAVPDDYCHTKIPAPNNDKPSGNDEPQWTPDWQDWIDYSGPCDEADMADAAAQMRPTSADD
jgi:hypothetical protein